MCEDTANLEDCAFYLNQKKISIENTPIRFDVIGINGDAVTHIENAFDFVMTS